MAVEGGVTIEIEEATKAAREGEGDRFWKVEGVGDASPRNGLLSRSGESV